MKKNGYLLTVLGALAVACLASAQVDEETGTVTNDLTQSRLRVANLVHGGPKIDLLVDGEIPVNRTLPQAGFPVGYVGAYLYLEPGTFQVAIVPTGKGIGDALVGPMDVTFEQGHRYTLALIGQMDDESLSPLIIDDTAALKEVRTSPGQGILFLINNLADTESMEFTLGGQGPRGVPYGGFAVAPLAQPIGEPLKIATDIGVIAEEAGPGMDPAMDFLVAFSGRLSDGEITESESDNTSDLSTLEFLRQFTGLGFEVGGNPLSFETFLAAAETTGLAEMLESGGPHLIFPPTDQAFADLGSSELEALFNDSEALTALLLNHIVDGYYPRGTLSGEENQTWVHTNLLGTELRVLAESINGIMTGDLEDYMVANGTRVAPIAAVILPPDR